MLQVQEGPGLTPMAIDIEDYYRRHGPMVLRRCRSLLRDEPQELVLLVFGGGSHEPSEMAVVGGGRPSGGRDQQGVARGQRNRGQSGTFHLEAPHQLRGEMLGIGGAAAVAENDELFPRPKRTNELGGEAIGLRGALSKTRFNLCGVFQVLRNRATHLGAAGGGIMYLPMKSV